MKHSRIIPLIFGFFIIYIGVVILLNNLGFHIGGGSIFPLLMILLGYYLLKKKKKILGYIFTIFGGLIFLDSWFGIDIFDIIGSIIAIGLIYFGYQMIRKKQRKDNDAHPKNDVYNETTNDEQKDHSKSTYRILTPQKKHSLIGNCHLTSSRWELTDMDIWYGLGEVKMDLSHANFPEQKATILINGWIGDVDIYIPYDLDVAIIARVAAGEIEIFGNKESGLNQTTSIETTGYRTAVKRVEIVINLGVGDIDVNYL